MLAYPWREIELTLTAERDYPNPYTNVEVWAEFTHDSGIALRRLAFWDGGRACAAGSRYRLGAALARHRAAVQWLTTLNLTRRRV